MHGTLDRHYNQLNSPLAAPGQVFLTNPHVNISSTPPISPGNFSGLRQGNPVSGQISDVKSKRYGNGYSESLREHKRERDYDSKRDYDSIKRDYEQRDNHDKRENYNRRDHEPRRDREPRRDHEPRRDNNIYKQDDSNRDFTNKGRDDQLHQEYYPDDTRESYKRDPSLLDRFSHLKSQQTQDRSRDYGNQDSSGSRSSNRYDNPDHHFHQQKPSDPKTERYEDKPVHLDKSSSEYPRRSDDYPRRSDDHFMSKQQDDNRMQQGMGRDDDYYLKGGTSLNNINTKGTDYISDNKYDNKYGSSQKPQQENLRNQPTMLGQQQQPNFNNNPVGMRPPFNLQQSINKNRTLPPPQTSNQYPLGPPGVYQPSSVQPTPLGGPAAPFQKHPTNHTQQPPLDFSKPPPAFNGPRPDFYQPPPGFNGTPGSVPLPDFTKPPPGFSVPPPDFSKPPPNFQVPPQTLQPSGQQQQLNQVPPGANFPLAPTEGFPKPGGKYQNPHHLPVSNVPPTSFQNTPSFVNFQGNNSHPGFPNQLPFQQQQQFNRNDKFNYEHTSDQRYPDPQNPESLGSEDYSKIAQALQTIQSTNYDQTDEGSQYGGSQHEIETKEKEKKSKKHKKQKKKEKKKEKKEKEIKRRLEEKLAELALLNNDDVQEQEISEKPPGSLSIQIKQPQSKFNLKIESPLMRGNIFQKYKDKKDSPLFAGKAADHGERKYRRIADQQEDEDSDTDLEEEKQKAEQNEPQSKEELLQMLDIQQPAYAKTALGKDDALYSGSEEGEVISDEEELAERKRIKEMIFEAKNEAMRELEVPQSEPLPSSVSSAKVFKARPKKKVEKHPDSDGELSSDGEVSSDGELSDDSVDEFGRLKKFRHESERVSDDDRKYKYSSGSDSSDTDVEKERWSKVQSE